MPSISGPCEVTVGEGFSAFTIGRDQQFEQATLSIERLNFELKTQATDAPDDYTKTGINVGLSLSISDASNLTLAALAFNTSVQGSAGSQYIALADDAGKGYVKQKVVIKPYAGDVLSPPENWWVMPAAAAVTSEAFESAFGLTTQRGYNLRLMGLADTGTYEKIFTMPNEVRTFSSRATAAGGSVSAGTLSALYTFIKGLGTDGLYDRLYEIGVFAGTGLGAALVKLDTLPGVQTSFSNSGFSGGDYSETAGLLGDGAKSLNTGFNPTPLGLDPNDLHLAIMTTAVTTIATETELLANTSATSRLQLATSTSTTGSISHICDSGSTNIAVASQNGTGLYIGSRINSTDHRLYKDGTQIGTTNTTANTSTVPNTNITLMSTSKKRLKFYSIGRGLTAAQVTALTSRVNALQTALGR